VVLSDLSGENVLWRKYNDQRFDGPWEQSVLENDYPNLRQVSIASVQAKTLAEILDSQSCLRELNSKFNLIIRQGDPLRVLKGAKSWLYRCIRVTLRGVDIPTGYRSECITFLFSNGFSFVDEEDLSILNNNRIELLEMQSNLRREFYEIPEDDPCLKALEALFPYHFYRSLRPDLDCLDDRKLLEHFCTNGLKEGIRLEDGVEMQYAVRALRHVFPYSFYRRLCPDLTDLDDESLLLYFCRNGLDQRIDLSEESVQSFAGSFPVSEVEVLKSRVKELEQYLDLSREQVSELRNALMAANKNDDQ